MVHPGFSVMAYFLPRRIPGQNQYYHFSAVTLNFAPAYSTSYIRTFMKALRFLLYIALGILALVLILGLFARKSYVIERSIEIAAPKALVMDQVRYFRKFDKWSPWKILDPDRKVNFEGADGEPGAMYKWDGNDDVGSGYQTLKTVSDNQIEIEVARLQPWEAKSMTRFVFEEAGEKIRVTWRFNMIIGFPWNGLAMFTDVDAGIGPDQERGLALLKKQCEGIINKEYRGYEVTTTESAERTYLGLRKGIAIAEVQAFFAENIPALMEAVKKNKLEMIVPQTGMYWVWDTLAMKVDLAV